MVRPALCVEFDHQLGRCYKCRSGYEDHDEDHVLTTPEATFSHVRRSHTFGYQQLKMTEDY